MGETYMGISKIKVIWVLLFVCFGVFLNVFGT